MSYSQSFPNSYYSNHEETDDSSSVFDAETVVSDEVPSSSPLPPLPSATTITTATEYDQQHDNNKAISLSSSPSQSPPTSISQLLRRINSRRPMPSPTITSEEGSSNQSSSSSSKKDIVSDAFTNIHSLQRPRQSSQIKGQSDQSCAERELNSESENEDLDLSVVKQEDQSNITEATSINNLSSSSSSPTSKKLTKNEIKWKTKFEMLCAYKNLHGNANVPKRDKQLGQFVQKQRHEYKKLKKSERMQMMVGSRLDFARLQAEWNEIFSDMSNFKDFFGHTNVPKGYNQLSNWVSSQRKEYNGMNARISSCMTPERIQMLESIDFDWSPPTGGQRNESVWDKKFSELCEYKMLHGNTNPTLTTNQVLSRWVSRQRQEYKAFQANKKAAITTKRIQLLNSIGFQWSLLT